RSSTTRNMPRVSPSVSRAIPGSRCSTRERQLEPVLATQRAANAAPGTVPGARRKAAAGAPPLLCAADRLGDRWRRCSAGHFRPRLRRARRAGGGRANARLVVSYRPQPCARSLAQPIEAAQELADTEIPDPVEVMMRREAVETAVSRFAELPTMQRSVVILK